MKPQRKLPPDSNPSITVLSVSPEENDHRSFQRAWDRSTCLLYEANGLASALSLLHRHEIGVVLCERDLQEGTWIDVLQSLALLRDAPPLIVTSRFADERLWAEALNRGAYDVLAKPFDRQELVRTVNLAWLHWRHRHDLANRGETKVMAAG